MPPFPGTPGDDELIGTDGADVITGLAGNDRLYGLGGEDVLDGGDDSDFLDGGLDADAMTGGAGDDYFVVDNAADQVLELPGGGADLVFTFIDYALPDEVERLAVYNRSSTHAVNLSGNSLDNELTGNDGANFLDGGDGQDIMKGAGGDDQYLVSLQGTVTLSYRPSGSSLPALGYLYLNSTQPDVIQEHAGGGTDTVWVPFTGSTTAHSWFDYTLIKGSSLSQPQYVENLAVYDPSTTYSVNLQGDGSNNEVRGNAGQNVLDGWGGADRLIGYAGDDIYFVDQAGDLVIEAAGEGYDTVYITRGDGVVTLSGTYILPANVERVVAQAGNLGISMQGNELDNEIIGGPGNDILNGSGGADLMMGGDGDDRYSIDNLGDRIVDTGGVDSVEVSFDYTLPENLENLWGGGTVGLTLVGNAGSNGIRGSLGGDLIDGGAGADVLRGDRGNDVYLIDSDNDQILEEDIGGLDIAYTSVSYSLPSSQFSQFGFIERLGAIDRGSTHAMDLTGNELANEIWGNDGANVINGRLGSDILQGLGGADRFVFNTSLIPGLFANIDQLIDFEVGTDIIVLDDSIFAALTPGALPASAFVVGTLPLDADDFIRYDPSTGALWYDGDGNGSAFHALQFAVVHEGIALTSADFLVV